MTSCDRCEEVKQVEGQSNGRLGGATVSHGALHSSYVLTTSNHHEAAQMTRSTLPSHMKPGNKFGTALSRLSHPSGEVHQHAALLLPEAGSNRAAILSSDDRLPCTAFTLIPQTAKNRAVTSRPADRRDHCVCTMQNKPMQMAVWVLSHANQ